MIAINKILKNIHFISYGDEKYRNAKNRIYKEALRTKWFDSINVYGKKDLSEDFKQEFRDILCLNRGGGYWIWKFDIILRRLSEINEGEILVYCDSGCTINKNGEKRFKEYIDMLNNSKIDNKIISFQMGHKENVWTIKEIFKNFNVEGDKSIEGTGQYIGCILIMKKCDSVIRMFNECLNKLRNDHNIITDKYNTIQEYKGFIDNRHDQSILSVARKIYESVVLSDETWGKNFNSSYMLKIPFLATRKN